MPSKLFIVLMVVNSLLTCLNAAFFLFPEKTYLFVVNARAGCFPWSPKLVEYYDGMTLCPGQIATGQGLLILKSKP